MKYSKEKEIYDLLGWLNKIVQKNGFKVVLGKRYGYKALDLYKDNALCKTIIAGLSTGACYDYVCAMLEGINLVDR